MGRALGVPTWNLGSPGALAGWPYRPYRINAILSIKTHVRPQFRWPEGIWPLATIHRVRSAMLGEETSEDKWPDGQDRHEVQSPLLASNDEQDPTFQPGPVPPPIPSRNAPNGKRHSSISQPAPDGQRRTPRTMNRVRFDLEEEPESPGRHSIDRVSSPDDELWVDAEDYELGTRGSGTQHNGQSIPLLTNIEAPSVTLATSDDFFPEEHLEDARPRSGMKMAFMNMANSIIGAGIIGQPYALRQAGMTMGILLLTALTFTVDWTIRLIVINSKMSGADSFQATMQYCFGKSGLIAISIAQWAFAFGGMVAFCIIVGDTIPHVLSALFPSLKDMSFLWLLTNRRAVIVIFVMGVSYPLSMYRDIAKVGLSYLMIMRQANPELVGKGICIGIDQHDHHCGYSHHSGFPSSI